MKILFPYMARWCAVNWTRYHSLLNELCDMGHEVFVLQPPGMESQETNFQEIDADLPTNLHLIDVTLPAYLWDKKYPFDKLFKKGIYSIWCKKTVDRIVREEGIDTLLLYNIPQYFLSRTKACKVVFDVADDYIPMLAQELGRFANRFTLGVAKYVFEDMIAESDHILAVSHVIADDINVPVTVIPNGVDPVKARRSEAIKLSLELDRPAVGFIGAFEYFIDFELILTTAQMMPDVTFLLVGGGRLWESVNRSVMERGLSNVVLKGGVPHEEVFAHIEQMDICLNIFEKIRVSHAACPIKMFEYMIMGKPVISTRLDEVERMKLPSLLFADSPTELKNCILELFENPEKMKQIGLEGQRLTNQGYTWLAAAHSFSTLISDQDV